MMVKPPQQLNQRTQLLPTYSLLGTQINRGSQHEFLDAIMSLAGRHTSSFVCFANAHMLVEADEDPDFRKVLDSAALICPDGRPLGWAARFFHGFRQEQIAGPDILPLLLERAAKKHMRIFILGTTNQILEAFRSKVAESHGADIIAGTLSPPFRALTDDEQGQIAERINSSLADFVFVALGCPKQEKWMNASLDKVNTCMLGLGYAIPVYSGFAKRAPKFIIEAGLEWVYRLLQDPTRLFSRYARTNIKFVAKLIRGKGLS